MTRYIPYLAYAVLIGFHDVILADLTSIAGIKINLAILVVAALALYKSEIESAWAGFFLGILSSSVRPELIGWNALVMAFIAVAVVRSRRKLNLESIMSRVSVITGAVLAFTLYQAILEGFSLLLWRLVTYVVPVVIYTALVAWLFFLIKDGKVTMRKAREIF